MDDPLLNNSDLTSEMQVLIRDFFGENIRLNNFKITMSTPEGHVQVEWARSLPELSDTLVQSKGKVS